CSRLPLGRRRARRLIVRLCRVVARQRQLVHELPVCLYLCTAPRAVLPVAQLVDDAALPYGLGELRHELVDAFVGGAARGIGCGEVFADLLDDERQVLQLAGGTRARARALELGDTRLARTVELGHLALRILRRTPCLCDTRRALLLVRLAQVQNLLQPETERAHSPPPTRPRPLPRAGSVRAGCPRNSRDPLAPGSGTTRSPHACGSQCRAADPCPAGRRPPR